MSLILDILGIRRISTNAHQNNIYGKTHSFGIEHIKSPLLLKGY